MKKTILLILCSASLLFASCGKWLDVSSDTDVSNDSQFDSEEGFMDAAAGTYLLMTKSSIYGREWSWDFLDVLVEPYRLMTANLAAQESAIQNRNYTAYNVRPLIDRMWIDAYNVIANANNILSNLERKKDELHPAVYGLIKGEMLGVRAYVQLDLMRVFGYGNLEERNDMSSKWAVPYVVEYRKNETPQLSYAETFGKLFEDIDSSIALLEEYDPEIRNYSDEELEDINLTGFFNDRHKRMNYYAALALSARARLWEGSEESKAKALEAAKTVIAAVPSEFQWVSEAAITADQKNRDLTCITEHIFALDVQRLNQRSLDTSVQGTDLSFATVVNSVFDASANQYTAHCFRASDALEIFENNSSDYRLSYMFVPQTVSGDNMMTPVKMYQSAASDKTEYLNTVPLIKIAEMYYIAAECDPANAAEYLSEVRTHRGITTGFKADADMSEELMKEYRKEFVADGQLFFFYKRKGISELPSPRTVSSPMSDETYILPYPDNEIMYGNREQF